MNPYLFSAIATVCGMNYSGNMCNKTSEAYLKYEGAWNFGEKLGQWASNELGKTQSVILATGFIAAKDQRISFAFGNETRYALKASRNDGIATVSWRW